jgi:DNA-binding LytR/AlgR family response regulator
MKIYIVEDEPLAAEHLQNTLLSLLPEAEIGGKADNVQDAVRWLSSHQPDLIFMDIQLGDALSFEIFSQVKVEAPVIFTTAYDKYAIQAFQANGIGYLLKPVSRENLQDALQKLDTLRRQLGNDAMIRTLISQIRKPAYRERFMVTTGQKLRSVTVAEVAWFSSEGRYTKLMSKIGQNYLINDTLEKLEEMLDPVRFFRVNRKYMVAMDSIVNMVPWSKSRIRIELQPRAEEDVIVSIERSAAFKQWLDY